MKEEISLYVSEKIFQDNEKIKNLATLKSKDKFYLLIRIYYLLI